METETEIQYNVDDEPIVLSKHLVGRLLKHKKYPDLLGLYTFYYYTAKWQKTNVCKCTNNYAMKGLKWGKERLLSTKKILVAEGLVTPITRTHPKSGKVAGHYLKVNLLWSQDAVESMIKSTRNNPQKTTGPETRPLETIGPDNQPLVGSTTNALSLNNKIYPPEYLELSTEFHNRARENFPTMVKESSLSSRINNGVPAIDKLIRLDDHSLEFIQKILKWGQQNDFWAVQLLGLSNIRKCSKRNGETKFTNLVASYSRHRHDDPHRPPRKSKQTTFDISAQGGVVK